MTTDILLEPGKNCWKIAPCERAAFLVDGEAYYSTLATVIRQARHAVYIIGWDMDSRIRLVRSEERDDLPRELGPFLDAVVSRREGLEIYMLDWDFAMLYALEREALPIFKFGWRTHKRLHFRMDDKHPVGSSHHQKLVVADDQIAFCGGFDLAKGRWDTPEHAPEESGRHDNGASYPPFHDVQMMVDGAAARALGELARERWRWACGQCLEPPPDRDEGLWPVAVSPDLERIEVAILRTEPTYENRPQISEVKNFYLDAIKAARSSIYIENQYFTAQAVGEALAERLQEKDGPEIILVLPKECSGWLEEGTMGVLRARLIRQLRGVDRHGRLRVYYPHRQGLGDQVINVHAKVLVVDDRLVRIGSSNLNNRSMGFDTECDLAVDAGDNPELRKQIAAFRNRLLGEHLGTPVEKVAEVIQEHGSLAAAVEARRGAVRSLEPLEAEIHEWVDELAPDSQLVDPEQPVSMDELIGKLGNVTGNEEGKSRKGPVLGLVLGAALLLAALWRWTYFGDWISVNALVAWGATFRDSAFAPLIALAAFVIGGLILFPVTLLILATVLAFGPVFGFVYALSGGVVSALSTYGIGRLLGRDRVRQLAGGKLNRISQRLAKSGLLAVAVVRVLPVAPFTVVNLVAGASHIKAWDFFLGTLLGMAPGTLAITIFEEGLSHAVENPGPGSILLLTIIVVALIGAGWLGSRWLQRKEMAPEENPHG